MSSTIRDRDAAVQREVVACMSGLGFNYEPAPAPENTASATNGLFGPTDLERAKQQGFLVDEGPAGPLGDAAVGGIPTEPAAREAWMRALQGDLAALTPITSPEDGSEVGAAPQAQGCTAVGLEAVHGSTESAMRFDSAVVLVQRLRLDAYTAMITGPVFDELSESWHACMSGLGFSTELGLGQVAAQEWPEPRPTEIEIHTAVADVECRVQIDAERRATSAMAKYVDSHIDSYRDILTALTDASLLSSSA